jgi:DNA-binding transcriptional LysR family regulator
VKNGRREFAERLYHCVELRVEHAHKEVVFVLNIHHLELFYYVAQHRGITAAVRQMPYGIQQPAVSGQMSSLEEAAGATLFERSPFRLTPAGEVLFAHVRPFFDGLDAVAGRVREAAAPRLRVGAAELIMRDHLHPVIDGLRRDHPQMTLSLRSGYTRELARWLCDGEIDVAIAPIEGKLPARLRSARLLRIPLVLVVPRASKLKSAAELWAKKRVKEPLVAVPGTETVSRLFQQGLGRKKVKWPTAIEASSLELVASYVQRGYGLGVNVALPSLLKPRGVRSLPLEGFAPVEVAIFWQGAPTPLVQRVIDEARRYVRAEWPELVWPDA